MFAQEQPLMDPTANYDSDGQYRIMTDGGLDGDGETETADTDGGVEAVAAADVRTTGGAEKAVGTFGGTDRLPVDRDYVWDEYVPTRETTAEFQSTNGEKAEIRAEIDARDITGKKARILLGGPTGAGKTLLAWDAAADYSAPLFTIQASYGMNEADLLGAPIIDGEGTAWTDGVLTKALLCSQERLTFLLVDEANRARARGKASLYSALDDRCEVVLNGRGGEVVRGNPMNLVVIATINQGTGHMVEKMDVAEKRRFGNKWDVGYLGVAHPEQEAKLITDRTPAGTLLAAKMVEIANNIRDRAEDAQSSIGIGIPTSTVIEWAQTAAAYHNAGLSSHEGGAIIAAAENSIVRPLYGDDEEAVRVVADAIESSLKDAPFPDEEFADWLPKSAYPSFLNVEELFEELGLDVEDVIDSDVPTVDSGEDGVICADGCGFEAPYDFYAERYPDEEAWMDCPNCESVVRFD